MQKFNKQFILGLLSEIKDPEIPVINIVEMGIVQDVLVNDDELEVILTPTYSGCPAMDLLDSQIHDLFIDYGFSKVNVTKVYKPAWTTDWMTAQTKGKLRSYGIAPPQGLALGKRELLSQKSIICPLCSSDNTEQISHFGSTACKALYKCKM